jgi:hypothetical protein
MENIKQTIRDFGRQLESIGITNFNYSDSVTSFGESSYLMVGPFKVRYSDHGVSSVDRIMSELHLCKLTWNMHLETIERYFFPERFEEVTTLEFGWSFEHPADMLYKETFEYKIINPCVFVTKKGRVMVKMRRRNNIVKRYVRK